ncbi:MAG: proline racemase family protein [Desulfopila sp.]
MKVIDSHTGGEPTRVVIEGGPDLGSGSMKERRQLFQEKYDAVRQACILEPRGTDALVGALLCPPVDRACVTGVIFFNNSGFLGMCGHASIGVAVTLHYMGKIGLGVHRLETPVGIVTVSLTGKNDASVENIASYCHRRHVELAVDGMGTVTGDVAWGGNWFFLVDNEPPQPLHLANVPMLTASARQVKRALERQNITGRDGEEIDHIEFFSAPQSANANSRNFVLCPGNEYDRSPCGTGTSAKLACLAAKGLLEPGQKWVQESVIGSTFTASYRVNERQEIIPTISGSAYICGETTLIQQDNDPFISGILG